MMSLLNNIKETPGMTTSVMTTGMQGRRMKVNTGVV